MTSDYITGFFYEAIKITILLSAPMLLAGLLVGLLVSIFQSATSINEMTLTFIPKLVVMFLVLVLMGPWLIQVLVDYVVRLFSSIPALIG